MAGGLDREALGLLWGWIVRDPKLHERAVEKIRKFVEDSGKEWKGLVTSPITGTDGNVGFLAWIG